MTIYDKRTIITYLLINGFTEQNGRLIRENEAVVLGDDVAHYMGLSTENPHVEHARYEDLEFSDNRLCIRRKALDRSSLTVFVDRKKRMSNIEKLRSMDVPELAEFLRWYTDCDVCMCRSGCDMTGCAGTIENWLREESK